MRKPILAIIVLCLLVVSAAGFYQCTKELSEWRENLEGSRNPSEYQGHLTEWSEGRADLIKHFPAAIGDHTFYYFFRRGFLQGGSSFHVGLELTEDQFKELYSATLNVEGENDDFPKPGLHPVYEHGNYSDWAQDYIFKYLGAKNTSGLDYWNHGYIFGIAFSKKEPKVIFFAESW